MAKSVIVEVRKALVAGIRAVLDDDLDYDGVEVTYAWDGSDDDARRDQIFTNRPRATHEPASLKTGRTFRNERMQFDVVVMSIGVAQRPEDVDDHVLDLGQVVEEFVADNNSGGSLGVAGLNWITVSGMELANRIGSEGSISELTYTITYDARLT